MSFTPAALKFLRSLKRNNDRDWFEKHRDLYEKNLRTPSRSFIDEIRKPLLEVFPTLKADYRSIGRINRDTRFSSNKEPYKEYASFMFRDHTSKEDAFPSLYFGFDSTGLALGCGSYLFSKPVREHFRDRVTSGSTAKEFSRVVKVALAGQFQVRGRDLKKIPPGFDPEHENAEFLRHNGLYLVREFDPTDRLFREDFPRWVVSQFKPVRPFFLWMREMARSGPRDMAQFLT